MNSSIEAANMLSFGHALCDTAAESSQRKVQRELLRDFKPKQEGEEDSCLGARHRHLLRGSAAPEDYSALIMGFTKKRRQNLGGRWTGKSEKATPGWANLSAEVRERAAAAESLCRGPASWMLSLASVEICILTGTTPALSADA